MFRIASRLTLSPSTAAIVASALVYQRTNHISSCDGEQPKTSGSDRANSGLIALYLNQESRDHLKRYLSKSPLFADDAENINPKYVVIKRMTNPNDSFEYEPLFGERAAFRLKSVIETKDGRRAGFGRVGVMTGQIADEAYEASIVLEPGFATIDSKESLKKYIESMDLPTRLLITSPPKACVEKAEWTGRIKKAEVANTKYDSVEVKVHNIPPNKQLVIDGYVCSSEYVNAEGKCDFDRTAIVAFNDSNNDSISASAATANKAAENHKVQISNSHSNKSEIPSDKDSEESASKDGTKKECPVCTYMKAGPCKSEFVEWDKCLDSLKEGDDMKICYDTTMVMMDCMRKFEYYDIMTAGTHEKYEAAQQHHGDGGAAAVSEVSK